MTTTTTVQPQTTQQQAVLQQFVGHTEHYVAELLDLATSLEPPENEVTATLLLVYLSFVADAALTLLERVPT